LAIRTFFRFIAIHEPGLLLQCQQVLAIPAKRHDKRIIDFLEPAESAAFLGAPDITTWIGRRDRTLLLVALQTGLRVSELIGLNVADITLLPRDKAYLQCFGKGRKKRVTPLRSDSIVALTEWQQERGAMNPEEPLFITNRQDRFSRDGIERIVRKY
jgi:site-specific recombinase XerD